MPTPTTIELSATKESWNGELIDDNVEPQCRTRRVIPNLVDQCRNG